MKRKESRSYNLLTPGEGTPWEDRGSLGALVAFFKTVVMSITAPGKLLHSIRRPETDGDTRPFVFLCGVFWGIAWLTNAMIAFSRRVPKELPPVVIPGSPLPPGKPRFAEPEPFDLMSDGGVMLLKFGLGIVGTWVLLQLISRLFFKLASAGEMKAKAPPVLAFNVYAYCLGPSIFAVIPFYNIGPLIALVWIIGLFIFGASSRLGLKVSGAIICNLLACGAVLGGTAGIYYLAFKVYDWLT